MFKPNRELLNVNFEGYKLSDAPLSCIQEDLHQSVSVVKLKGNEFSYQRMRAYALHNHLHCDPSHPSSVYWCADDHSIKKVTLERLSVRHETVMKLTPPEMQFPEGASNITMAFLSDTMGVVCMGGNEVAVFCREYQDDHETWDVLKSLVLSGENPVILVTASLGATSKHADMLCAEIKKPAVTGQDSEEGMATYKWIRAYFNSVPVQTKKDLAGMTILGIFKAKSLALYASFQHQSDGETQLLIISETTPLIDEAIPPDNAKSPAAAAGNVEQDISDVDGHQHHGLGYQSEKGYTWTQSEKDVSITFKLALDIKKTDISCVIEPGELVVGLTDGSTLLRGELMHPVDPEASNWTIENNR